MNINLKQLETFVYVSDLGSFRRAATRLNTTQPNISARIATLERTLNVTLMERDAGSVRLTPKGIDLLVYARQTLACVENLIEAVDDTSLYDDVLRLGVTEMVVSTWLRDFLKSFKQRYPNTSVELTVDLSVNLEQQLTDRTIDLAFQNGPFANKTTGELDLGSFPFVWVVASNCDLPVNKSLTLDDLSEYSIITHARNTQSYREIVEHISSHEDLKIRLVPSSNLSACVQMTVDGFGVAALLLPMIEDELKNGLLKKVDYYWVPQRLSFYARFDQSRSSKVVRRAAEMAKQVSNDFAILYLE